MDLSKIRLDVDRAEAGEWIESIPGLGDVALKVRGSNSVAFRSAQAKALRSIPRTERRENGLVSPRTAELTAGQVLAEAVLMDWRNVQVDGKELPFSRETALQLLTDPELQVFRDGVAWAADQVADLRKASDDDSLGK